VTAVTKATALAVTCAFRVEHPDPIDRATEDGELLRTPPWSRAASPTPGSGIPWAAWLATGPVTARALSCWSCALPSSGSGRSWPAFARPGTGKAADAQGVPSTSAAAPTGPRQAGPIRTSPPYGGGGPAALSVNW